MSTNRASDEQSLRRAMKIGSLRTKRETVNTALKEFIDRRLQKRILELQGKISFREDWDYRKER
jgi:Arc/MetJ family transcription regulator